MTERSAQILGSAIIVAGGALASSSSYVGIFVGVPLVLLFGILFLRSCIHAEQQAAADAK